MKQTGTTATPVNLINKPVVNAQPSQYFICYVIKVFFFVFEAHIILFWILVARFYIVLCLFLHTLKFGINSDV